MWSTVQTVAVVLMAAGLASLMTANSVLSPVIAGLLVVAGLALSVGARLVERRHMRKLVPGRQPDHD